MSKEGPEGAQLWLLVTPASLCSHLHTHGFRKRQQAREVCLLSNLTPLHGVL